jgi:hypothetical protein
MHHGFYPAANACFMTSFREATWINVRFVRMFERIDPLVTSFDVS